MARYLKRNLITNIKCFDTYKQNNLKNKCNQKTKNEIENILKTGPY